MLIGARTTMLNAGGVKIPYQKVEYVEAPSQRNAWIDTGVPCETNMRALVRFRWLSGAVGGDQYIVAQSGSTRFYFGTYTGKWMFGLRDYDRGSVPLEDVDYEADVKWLAAPDYSTLDIDGAREMTLSNNKRAVSDNGTMLVLGRQNSSLWAAHARVYWCKLWKDDELVWDGVPVRDGTVGGMYDLVSRQLHVSAGLNSLVAGPDIR